MKTNEQICDLLVTAGVLVDSGTNADGDRVFAFDGQTYTARDAVRSGPIARDAYSLLTKQLQTSVRESARLDLERYQIAFPSRPKPPRSRVIVSACADEIERIAAMRAAFDNDPAT